MENLNSNSQQTIELINSRLVADYIRVLPSVQFKKLVLFPVFPVTGAPNISTPVYFAYITNVAPIASILAGSRN